MATIEQVQDQIKQVFDPEIPVNVYDLGFIYDIAINGNTCNIKMTLTSQHCPAAKDIPDWIKRKVNTVEGIDGTEIEIVWEPAWSPQLITEDGRKILGIDEDGAQPADMEEDEF